MEVSPMETRKTRGARGKPRRNTVGPCRAVWIGLAIAAVAATAGAQPQFDAWNIEVIGQVGGGCMGIQSDGQYAYIGEGPNLTILDVSGDGNPTPVKRIRFHGVISDVFLDTRGSRDVVYVAGWTAGVKVVDVTNPEEPDVVGSYDMNAYTIHVNQDTAYVSRLFGGIEVLDVSGLSSPTKAGDVPLPILVENIWTSGTLAFMASTRAGLIIYDISEPTTPIITAFYGEAEAAFDVVTSGVLGYVSGKYLYVVDFTELSSPTIVSTHTLTGYGMGMFLQQERERVYLGTTSGTLHVFDVADPSSPTLLGSWDGATLPIAVYVVADTAYVCDAHRGLYVLDVSDPSTPTVTGFYGTPIGCHVTRIPSASHAYLAAYDFYSIDINDPSNPTVFNIYETPHELAGVDTSGNLAFLTHNVALDLLILNIGDPANPYLVGHYETDASGEDRVTSPVAEGPYPDYVGPKVAVRGNKGIVSGFTTGSLEILDIGTPSSPTLWSRSDMPGLVGDIDIQGNTAYVANGEEGLKVLNISDPTNVQELDDFTSAWALSFQLSDVTGYIGDGGEGFWIVDLADPSSATLEGNFVTSGPTYGIDYSGGLVFTASATYGLHAVDVTDPSSPTLMGYFRSEGHAVDVRYHGGLIYLADTYTGLWILKYTGPPPGGGTGGAATRSSWLLYR